MRTYALAVLRSLSGPSRNRARDISFRDVAFTAPVSQQRKTGVEMDRWKIEDGYVAR